MSENAANVGVEIVSPSPILVSRIEKAAVDNGFDRVISSDADWFGFGSTQCPLRIWLGTTSLGAFAAAFSMENVGSALRELGEPIGRPLPTGAVAGCFVADIPKLHHLVRRAYQLAKVLPDQLHHQFIEATRSLVGSAAKRSWSHHEHCEQC